MKERESLYDDGNHKNILLEDFGHGKMVQSNVHMIVENGQGLILDPGGQKVFKHLMSEVSEIVGFNGLKYIFLSLVLFVEIPFFHRLIILSVLRLMAYFQNSF